MPAYETDHEQIEILKKWWADYGKLVLVAILIGLSIGFGWKYWRGQQVVAHQKASMLYQQLIVADSEKNKDSVLQINAEITKRYPRTEYANMADLFAAKAAMSQNNTDLAWQKLQNVMKNSKITALKQIARLRAARILVEQKKMQPALDLLATVDDKTFQPMIDEVKGDIYFAMGNPGKARELYQSAKVELSSLSGEDKLLSMKLAQ